MPVAVHLVEILTLLTLFGLITGFSLFVVVAQRIIFLFLVIMTPMTYFVHGLLAITERILVGVLSVLLRITNNISDSM